MGKLWSYKKPTEPGEYDANRGDVVIRSNRKSIELTFDDDGYLVDQDGVFIEAYHQGWKFRPVDYEYLNKIGNE